MQYESDGKSKHILSQCATRYCVTNVKIKISGRKEQRLYDKMYTISTLSLCFFVAAATADDVNIHSEQVFAIPIVPRYFNWTSDGKSLWIIFFKLEYINSIKNNFLTFNRHQI